MLHLLPFSTDHLDITTSRAVLVGLDFALAACSGELYKKSEIKRYKKSPKTTKCLVQYVE
jgi:hypothetical protein